ncbi:MAG: hypothetical protein IT373_25225 [Polyangiaceae bacterium]|nr:hypothetical protein [Polyangiaceae bacterium]
MRISALIGLFSATVLLGCGDSGGPGSASTSSSAAPAPTPKPTTSTAATTSSEPDAPPRSDCPKDSKGGGTLKQPCEATGSARLMEAKWNNKMDAKGPFFNVQNKSGSVVNYGQVQIYFYDSAGKQLETKDGKKRKTCAGANLFMGTLKPDEKALLQFACLKKDGVPDGATAIEAELDVVGLADKADEKKVDLYWRNQELGPDERPKGGAKPAK